MLVQVGYSDIMLITCSYKWGTVTQCWTINFRSVPVATGSLGGINEYLAIDSDGIMRTKQLLCNNCSFQSSTQSLNGVCMKRSAKCNTLLYTQCTHGPHPHPHMHHTHTHTTHAPHPYYTRTPPTLHMHHIYTTHTHTPHHAHTTTTLCITIYYHSICFLL